MSLGRDFSYGLLPMYRDGDRVWFLLIQHQAGHWGFPKGHVEGQELPLATACREFEEEVGLNQYQVDEDVKFNEEYYPTVDGQIVHKTVTYWPAWVGSQQVMPQEEEVQDFGWFEYRPALKKLTFAGGKKILRQLKKHLDQQLTES